MFRKSYRMTPPEPKSPKPMGAPPHCTATTNVFLRHVLLSQRDLSDIIVDLSEGRKNGKSWVFFLALFIIAHFYTAASLVTEADTIDTNRTASQSTDIASSFSLL